MPTIKKILVILLGIVALLVLLNFGVTYWISKKLPSILQSEKDFPYNISYEELDINLINGSFTMQNIYIAPKDSTANALQQGAFGKIKTLEVQRFNLWALLRDDRIKVKRLILNTPEVILYERREKYNVDDDLVEPFKNSISTGSLEIRHGNFKMIDSLDNFKVMASNISIGLDNIRVDSTSLEQNVPVRYSDYHFKCDSLFYRVNKFYNIAVRKISSTDSTLTAENFRLVPQQTRKAFVALLEKEKDQFNITAQKITIPKAGWGFFRDTLFVHAPEVALEKVYANIYRGKMVKDDPTIKKMYSELLRSIKFDLKVDRLLLKNSVVEYEEQLDFSRPAAKVSFSRFYATVYNIYSPVNKPKLPTTTIDVQCLFMKTAPLKVKWAFNTMDSNDSFTISGHLQNIKSEAINPVSKPLMNATTTGELKDVRFTFNGNRHNATGTFAIEYEDLKVNLYKKDGKEKNKLLTALGNLVVKNDSKDKLKKTEIATTRLKDKSFFNFLWRCVQDGLKQTLLPKVVSKAIDKDGKKKPAKKRKKKKG